MQEWLNWPAWKASKPQKGFRGSNPLLSALRNLQCGFRFFCCTTGCYGLAVSSRNSRLQACVCQWLYRTGAAFKRHAYIHSYPACTYFGDVCTISLKIIFSLLCIILALHAEDALYICFRIIAALCGLYGTCRYGGRRNLMMKLKKTDNLI